MDNYIIWRRRGKKNNWTEDTKDPEKNKTSLEGEGLKQQLQQWASYGTIEQSAADAIKKVVDKLLNIYLTRYIFNHITYCRK